MRRLVVLALVTLVLPVAVRGRTETPIAPPTIGNAPGVQLFPAIAGDGSQSFAVWTDHREGTAAIYGARLGPGRELLDPIGVRLLDSYGRPAIAYGAGRFLVVDSLLQFAVLDEEARILARGTIAGEPGGTVRIVFDGRRFIVLWGINTVRAVAIDRDGALAGPASTIVPLQWEAELQDVAINGSRMVLLYTRGVDLYAAVLTATAAPISIDVLLSRDVWTGGNGAPAQASIASSDGGFTAAWSHFDAGDVAVARFDAAGSLLSGPVSRIASARNPRVVAAAGSMRLFTLEGPLGRRRLVSRALDEHLTAGAPVVVLEHARFTVGEFAATGGPDGTRAVAVLHHEDLPDAPTEIYAASGDTPSAPLLVTQSAAEQRGPAIAIGDDGPIVAWRELPESRIRASIAGRIAFDLELASPETPAVAAQGRTFLVTWADPGGVRAQLFRGGDALGAVLSLDPLGGRPAASSDGRDFVLAWASLASRSIETARVTTAGDVVARGSVDLSSASAIPAPALACDAGECILAWIHETLAQTCPRFGCVAVERRVKAVRFGPSLVPRDALPLDVTGGMPILVNGGPILGPPPIAAADAGAYALAWREEHGVAVRMMSRDGDLSSIARVAGVDPALASDAGGWLLVREVNGELVAMRLREGAPSYEFALARDAQARSAPALASHGARIVAAYERTTRTEAAGGVPRVYLTAIRPPEPKRRATRRSSGKAILPLTLSDGLCY